MFTYATRITPDRRKGPVEGALFSSSRLSAGPKNAVTPATAGGLDHDHSRVPPTGLAKRRTTAAPTVNRACAARVRMKLKLGAINDRHEREADRIAELATLPFQAPSGMLQRPDAPLHHSGSLPPRHRVDGDHALVNGGGRALAKETQADMQQRFGMDLGHVRIHTDAAAAHSAQALNAMAYTVGRDIVFAPNQYAPHTDRGRRLLAHELAHVVQQTDGTLTCDGHAGVVVQRAAQAAAPVGAAAVLGWCLSGAGISVLLDEAFQVGGWLLQGSDRGEFQQNWCRTIIAALLGCATGMAGGALRTMLAELGVASGLTLGALLRWLMAQGIRLPAHIVSFLGRQGCLEEELPANAGS